MTKFWIGVACQEHVQRAIEGSFAQVCHGKPGMLKRMSEGDWMVYYSPTIQFGKKEGCQSFTAIGKIQTGDPYRYKMTEQFCPWRRNVQFLPSKATPIKPLIEKLSFIKDKNRWGYPFRQGCLEISQADFQIIANEMGHGKL